MFEKFQSIAIQGRCFEKETNLKFFSNEKDRVSLIYGRNGSGKSTLSKGIKFAVDKTQDKDIFVKCLDDSESEISMEGIEDKIHVFNEDYIDKNIRIEDDGLGTIILIGKQVGLQAEIDHHTKLLEKAKEERDRLQEQCKKYKDPHDINSPEYHIKKINNTLKETDGWAAIDCKIRGNKKNSAVTDVIIKEIYELSPKESQTDLKDAFENKNDLYKQITDSTITFNPIPEIQKYSEEEENDLIRLLAQKIEDPVLTQRENQILNEIKKGNQNDIEKVKNIFLNTNISYCPYCYQEVTEKYKESLIESINKILNKDVDNHKIALSNIRFPDLSFDIDQYNTLDQGLTKQIAIKIKQCEEIIKKYKEFISIKQSNVYSPITTNNMALAQSISELENLMKELKKRKDAFDKAISEKKKIQVELLLLNKKIAYYNIKKDYENYQKQNQIREKIERDCKNAQQSYLKEESEIRKIQAQKTNIGIAIDNINNALEYIFFAKDRLTIELRNQKYYLKSKGKDVLPKNVSQGERNIVALSYFFTQIMENQEADKLFQKEQFIVIDDPISSFDFENRIGILSYLRYQLSQMLKCNDKSKIIILTHDLSTMFNLMKTIEDIAQSKKQDNSGPKITFSKLELRNGNIIDFLNKHNEYKTLLNNVYDYAENGAKGNDELTIGNIMRRVLEAFSTFVYNKGIEDLTNNSEIINAMGDKSTYFSNFMYRLILHGESHYQTQIHSMRNDLDFLDYISETEKQRTARDLLCMLYILNPLHIKIYIEENKKIDQIKQWLKAIKTDSEFELDTKDSCPKKIIKLYDYALSAGKGNDLMDDQVPHEDIEVNNMAADFAIKVSGDSMEPKIENGSIVLIKQTEVLEDGDIGAFFYDGEVYCKTLRKNKTGVVLESINTKYKPINIDEKAVLKICGKVIEKIDVDTIERKI